MKRATLAVLTLALTALPIAAQEDKEQDNATPLEKRINIDFNGGTLADLITVVEKQLAVRSNIVTDRDALRIKMPAIHLRSVTVMELLKAVSYLTTDLKLVQPSQRVVVISYRGERDEKKSNPLQVQAFNIGRYLENYKVEDIVTAIRTAWKMSRVQTHTEVKYHAETKLLIVAGSPNSLAAAHYVIKQLDSRRSKKDKK